MRRRGEGSRRKLLAMPRVGGTRPRTKRGSKSSTRQSGKGKRKVAAGGGAGVGAGAGARSKFVQGYSKSTKLGKGGYGVVWNATDAKGIAVAVKQAHKSDGKDAVEAAWKEVACSHLLTEYAAGVKRARAVVRCAPKDTTFAGAGAGAAARDKTVLSTSTAATECSPASEAGLARFMRLIESVDTPSDLWLVFEKGGEALSSLLFDIQGESYHGSRVYHIRQRSLFDAFHDNPDALRRLLRHLIQAVAALGAVGIVHADIKPENVLLKFRSGGSDVRGVKLIDLGSSYMFAKPTAVPMTTPEYLPPELLSLSAARHDSASVAEVLRDCSTPTATDMWSIGAIMLEIMSGVPLWMSYKSRVALNGQDHMVTGLFAAPQRDPAKIMAKQHSVVKNLGAALDAYPGLDLHRTDPASLDLLQRLLTKDPAERITPEEALRHSFLSVLPPTPDAKRRRRFSSR